MIVSHSFLSAACKKQFNKLIKERHYSREEKKLLAIALDQFETYTTAKKELDDYTKENSTFVMNGKAHPNLATMDKAFNNYLKATARLEKTATKETEAEDELDELLEGAE